MTEVIVFFQRQAAGLGARYCLHPCGKLLWGKLYQCQHWLLIVKAVRKQGWEQACLLTMHAASVSAAEERARHVAAGRCSSMQDWSVGA